MARQEIRKQLINVLKLAQALELESGQLLLFASYISKTPTFLITVNMEEQAAQRKALRAYCNPICL